MVTGDNMKITKNQLRTIIKEELKVVKRENNKLNENKVEISEYDDFVLVNYMVDEVYTIGYSVEDIRRLIAVLEAAIPKAEAGELEPFRGI
jgi:uncharacterized radical SAM superfamily protein